jgi:Kef-type K+ transport system membrane component KefB
MTWWALALHSALAILVTLAATHGLGRMVRRIHQPPVVGELIAGLLLGPTLLGALPGDPSRVIFPSQVTSILTTVGQIGVILYIFLVGLDLNTLGIARRGRDVITISLASLLVPLALGALLGAQLYSSHRLAAGHEVAPLAFVLFTGTAMAMTAFPVLARILRDTGLQRHAIGGLAISCAAIIDVLGWILLALALAVASSTGAKGLVLMVAEGAAFIVVLLVLIRPFLARLIARQPTSHGSAHWFLVVILAMMFASAAITDAIGLHPLFGALLFGAIYPRRRDPVSTMALDATLRPLTLWVILPFYFLVPGLHVNLREMLHGGLLQLALILAVACGGKLAGAVGATRARGYSWHDAAVMGTLMNTRGLIELVILSAGVSAHVLDAKLYGLMVVMALITTMTTGPSLRLLYGRRLVPQAIDRTLSGVVGQPLAGVDID